MSGMSNREPRATLISTPRPVSPPAHSATMAPITASVTPTRIPPRIAGNAAGTSTRVTTCQPVARKLRAISSRRGSTDRMPTIVATATGKNTISVVMTSFDASPVPNHRAISGARARIGVAWAATRYGLRSRSARRERASRTPVTSASPAPIAKPSSTSTSVVCMWGHIVPSVQARRNRSATVSGPGRMNGG